MIARLKAWLILKLGGQPSHDCKRKLWLSLSAFEHQVERACVKAASDAGLKAIAGSNLGRNIFRDEACEWTKLYLKDAGVSYRDSDIHLACELYYHLVLRGALNGSLERPASSENHNPA